MLLSAVPSVTSFSFAESSGPVFFLLLPIPAARVARSSRPAGRRRGSARVYRAKNKGELEAANLFPTVHAPPRARAWAPARRTRVLNLVLLKIPAGPSYSCVYLLIVDPWYDINLLDIGFLCD
jgi:hypothetical protein